MKKAKGGKCWQSELGDSCIAAGRNFDGVVGAVGDDSSSRYIEMAAVALHGHSLYEHDGLDGIAHVKSLTCCT